jgi:hypothetical protein
MANYFGTEHPMLGFDLIYEPSDKLNHDLSALNRAYENIIKTIHDIDPQRMIFIAPRLRAAPEDLMSLKLPGRSQNYLLAEWHIFPWGPLKNNGKYPWTSGTAAEKRQSEHALTPRCTGSKNRSRNLGWRLVGGETIKSPPGESQLAFAAFMACELNKAQIPFALNADTQFYDGEEGAWRPTTEPLLKAIISPDCEKADAKPDRREGKPPVHVHGASGAAPAAASSAQSKALPASSASQG